MNCEAFPAAAARRGDAGGEAVHPKENVHVMRVREHVLGGVVHAMETRDKAFVLLEKRRPRRGIAAACP